MSEEAPTAPENDRAPAPPLEANEVTASLKGYRQLTPTHQHFINEIKDAGEELGHLIGQSGETLTATDPMDEDLVRQAKEHLRIGFMLLVRSIAKPSSFALALLALLLGLVAPACALVGGQPTVVASVETYEPASPGARPDQLFRWDGNTLVVWAAVGGRAEVFLVGSGLPISGPYMVEAGTAYVRVEDPPFEWTGSADGTLPLQALAVFRPAEVTTWALAAPPPQG